MNRLDKLFNVLSHIIYIDVLFRPLSFYDSILYYLPKAYFPSSISIQMKITNKRNDFFKEMN